MHCICFSLPTLECAVPFQKMLLLQLQAPGPPLLLQGLAAVQRLGRGFKSGAHLDPLSSFYCFIGFASLPSPWVSRFLVAISCQALLLATLSHPCSLPPQTR